MYYVNSVFRRAVRPAFQGMGASQDVQVETSDVLSLGQQLRDAQARLTSLFQTMQSSPSVAQAIGRDVTAQQAQLGDLTSRYVYVYTAIFGQAPVGLGNPVLVAAAVAVILAYVGANLYLWYQKQDVLEKQAQAQILAEQNRSSVIDMAQQHQDTANQLAAAGDSAGAATEQAAANQLISQIGVPGAGAAPPPPGTQSITNWLASNWWVPAAAVALVFIAKK